MNLAFEYQGIQHYKDMYYFGSFARVYSNQDEEKRNLCVNFKPPITLIEIPYSWDNSKQTLLHFILKVSPKLINE